MKRQTLIFSLASLFFGCAGEIAGSADQQSLARGGQDKIVNGQVEPGIPGVGAIINGGQQWCTGSVIAPQWVLTAAHCIAENLQFGIGPNMNQLSEQVQVAETFIHPHYSNETLAHDVALLKLASPVSAQPLELVRSINTAVDHRSLLVGYGVDEGRGQTGNGTKRRTEVTFSEFTETEMIYRNFQTNSCNGDSGGPAFFYGNGNALVVAGITSSAADVEDQFCEMGGRYMRVDSYLDYIAQVMAGGAGEGVPGNQPEQSEEDEQPGQECIDWDGDGRCDDQPGQGDQQDCIDWDGDGRCDEQPSQGDQPNQGDQQDCVDWDGDGWCDEQPGQGDQPNQGDQQDCVDWDGDGWCDGQENPGGHEGNQQDCVDWDGDGWCDEPCEDWDGDGWCDEPCEDWDGDGWCD